MIAIDFDELPVQPFPVVFILRLHGDDLGLDALHVLHGLIALVLEGNEQQFDADCKKDNRDAVISGIVVNETEDVKDRLGDKFDKAPAPIDKPSEINSIFQTNVQGFERIEFFGTGIQLQFEGRRNVALGDPNTSGHELVAFLLDQRGGRFGGNQYAQEIFVLKSHPPDYAFT